MTGILLLAIILEAQSRQQFYKILTKISNIAYNIEKSIVQATSEPYNTKVFVPDKHDRAGKSVSNWES